MESNNDNSFIQNGKYEELGDNVSAPSYDPRILGRLSSFVLNRATNDLRSELYEYLVVMALHIRDHQNEPGIIATLEKELNVTQLPQHLIRNALDRAERKRIINRISERETSRYFLNLDQRKKFEILEQQSSTNIQNIKQEFTSILKKHIDSFSEEIESLTFSNFTRFIGESLSNMGLELCNAIIENNGKIPLAQTNVSRILELILVDKANDTIRDAERRAFIEYVTNPTEALSNYIYSLSVTYFIINILNWDPECQTCSRESLHRKTVYLDTNVIIDSITGEQRGRHAVSRALNLTKDLGITMSFSSKTRSEFITQVQNITGIYDANREIPEKRFLKFHNSIDDGLLKDFLTKRINNPRLSIGGYVSRLMQIESVLKNRYHVVLDNDPHNDIMEDSRFGELKRLVVKEGVRFGLHKSELVSEHDAFHIMLIKELRKNVDSDVLGPSHWFLTRDRSLAVVERKFDGKTIPSGIMLDNWVQLITPLIGPSLMKTARDVYVSLFSSRLPMLTKTIRDTDFLALQGKWMDDEDLSSEDIARIIGNKYVVDNLEIAARKGTGMESEAIEKLFEPIVAEVKRDRKKLGTEISSLRQELKEERKELDEERKLRSKYKRIIENTGYVVSPVTFLILWYFLYTSILLPTMGTPWHALLGSIIISSIVGYLAGFRGYKWLVERILKME